MQKLQPNSNFCVRESTTLNIILGLGFFILFIISLTDTPEVDMHGKYHFRAMYFALVPAVIFLLKGMARKYAVIQVNQHGIYHFNKKITDWNSFVKAYVTQFLGAGETSETTTLFIRYQQGQGIYEHKILLTNTQNKAEEEIIAAIKFFRDGHTNGTEALTVKK